MELQWESQLISVSFRVGFGSLAANITMVDSGDTKYMGEDGHEDEGFNNSRAKALLCSDHDHLACPASPSYNVYH